MAHCCPPPRSTCRADVFRRAPRLVAPGAWSHYYHLDEIYHTPCGQTTGWTNNKDSTTTKSITHYILSSRPSTNSPLLLLAVRNISPVICPLNFPPLSAANFMLFYQGGLLILSGVLIYHTAIIVFFKCRHVFTKLNHDYFTRNNSP